MTKAWHRWTPEELDYLRNNYAETGPAACSKALGLTYPQVSVRGRILGLKYKYPNLSGKKGSDARGPGCNEAYFRTFTSNSSYLLGYIWADGNVYQGKGGRVTLCAKKTDTWELFHQIKEEMKVRPPVHMVKRNGYSTKEMASLTICSKALVGDLISLHKVLPNKTYLDCPFPSHIPEEFLPHFVRGYFDGDGIQTVTTRTNRPHDTYGVGFCGQPAFIHQLRSVIINRVKIALPPVTVRNKLYARFMVKSRSKIQSIFNWMYPGNTNSYLRMSRKLDWFHKHLI